MLTFTRIASLSEVDFSTLFQDSLPEMEARTYKWPDTADTVEKKYHYVLDLINRLNPKGLFMYKVSEDGKDLSLIIGKLLDGELTTIFVFYSYNSNGSKSWVYHDSTAVIRQAFYDSCGITKINFEYLNTGSHGSKASLALGDKWSSTSGVETEKRLSDTQVMEKFVATLK